MQMRAVFGSVWMLAIAVSAPAFGQEALAQSSPSAVAAVSRTADEAFDNRMRTMEEQVTDLKEKVLRTKARLLLLQESVMGGDLSSSARASLWHRNEMGATFALESVAYALDGAPIFTKTDVNGDLRNKEELEIFNGRIVPGQHQIAVRLVYRGSGLGIFTYAEDYRFKVQSSFTFTAEPGKVSNIKIVGYEKGGLTTEVQDRPSVRYDVEILKDVGARTAASETPAASPALPVRAQPDDE
jgi:hypothetical protein